MQETGKDFAKFLSGTEKENFLKSLEIIHLLETGLPPLEKKVEYLATGVYNSKRTQDENNKITLQYFQDALGINPRDSRLKRTLSLATKICNLQRDKKIALYYLNYIRDIIISFYKDMDLVIKTPRFPPPLKASIPEGNHREKLHDLNEKAKEMLTRQKKILEEIVKNEEEYKILLERKRAGEPVEELIKKNRKMFELLKKQDKEHGEKAMKWIKSEEGRIWSKSLKQVMNMYPYLNKFNINTKNVPELSKEIQLNEEEYQKLLKRKGNGEYVDDLIKQNRYQHKILTQQKERIMDEK